MKVFFKKKRSSLYSRAETSNYKLSRELDLDLVPPTLENEKGIYQLGILGGIHEHPSSTGGRVISESKVYGKSKVFDYLTKQVDRNYKNMFVLDDGSIVLIDNEDSFLSYGRNYDINIFLQDRDIQYFFAKQSDWEAFNAKSTDDWIVWFDAQFGDLDLTEYNAQFDTLQSDFISRISNLKEKTNALIERKTDFFIDADIKKRVAENRLKQSASSSENVNPYRCHGCGCVIL